MPKSVSAKREASYRAIAAELGRDIVEGRLPPGARLTPQMDLMKKYGTCRLTVQRAIASLVRDGFVRTHAPHGTFVVDSPPHLSHYAVAFHTDLDDPASHFIAALRQAALKPQAPDQKFSLFFNLLDHGAKTADQVRLLQLVEARALAGVIFAFSPHDLEMSALLATPGVPRVFIGAKLPRIDLPCVRPDQDAFMAGALDLLAAHGRKRVAVMVMATGQDPHQVVKRVRTLASARSLEIRPEWVQNLNPSSPAWSSYVARILVSAGENRPDGLVIEDDNFVEAVTEGVAAAGVVVPRALEIVAHANFPNTTSNHVPVIRYGFDARKLLTLCIEALQDQREGRQPKGESFLAPVLEEDLERCETPPRTMRRMLSVKRAAAGPTPASETAMGLG